MCGLLTLLVLDSGAAEENIGVEMDDDDADGTPAGLELGFGGGDDVDLGIRLPRPVHNPRGR